jgi:hypothetical protein
MFLWRSRTSFPIIRMTPHNTNASPSGADCEAQSAGAPEAEIEVTPKMIEAGVRVLCENYLALCDSDEYQQIAETVFCRMVEASQRHSG